MSAHAFDVLRLDVGAFAARAGEAAGEWPLTNLLRLAGSAHPEAPPQPQDAVRWECRGEARPVRGGAPQTWLHLQADTALALECQRCLQPVATEVHAQRSLRFVPGEAQAAAEDAECEEDVLALARSLDLREMIEDELLLSLPLVPRHEACPVPLTMHAGEPAAAAPDKPNPFAALAALKARPAE